MPWTISERGTIVTESGYDTGVTAGTQRYNNAGQLIGPDGQTITDAFGNPIDPLQASQVGPVAERPTDVRYGQPLPVLGTTPGTETPIDNPNDPYWSLPRPDDIIGGGTTMPNWTSTGSMIGDVLGTVVPLYAAANTASGGGGYVSQPQATTSNAGTSAITFIRQMADPALQQLLLENERLYRPQYTALNLQDINQYLMGVGTPGQPGYTQGAIGLLGQTSPLLGDIQALANTQQRAADIADVAALGTQASQAFRAANPELYSQLARAEQLGGTSNYFGGLEQAIGGAQQFGPAMAQRVRSQNVGTGLLGAQMYGQALNAGPSAISQGLQQQGMAALAQGGTLTPAEIRQLQQGVREAYASRGTEMGSAAVTAEALAQQQAGRQRQLENLQLASGIGQQLTAEQQANRAYQQAVQQQELARQQSNVGTGLQAQLANQAALNQMALANREFAAGQQQQQIANLGLLGQLQQGQGAADRAYALQLAGAYGGASFDPMMAILGRQSTAPQMGQQQQTYASGLTGTLQGPQLFDPNAGVNIGLINQSNLGNYQAAVSGSQAAARGQILGGLLGGISNAIGKIF